LQTRPTFDEIYMDVVDVIARRSTCLRKRVGAVITYDHRILSHGYNGVPSGHEHCCDTGKCLKDLAGTEEVRARLGKASICAYKAVVATRAWKDEGERAGLVRRYIELCRRYDMTHTAENQQAEEYFAQL